MPRRRRKGRPKEYITEFTRIARDEMLRMEEGLRAFHLTQPIEGEGECRNHQATVIEYICVTCEVSCSLDTDPFHCNKCGVCREHRSESFHCDKCGMCMNKALKDIHGCRKSSEHDKCGVCFEDAFSGCMVLPCSHKLHPMCIGQLNSNGMNKCPVCRARFDVRLCDTRLHCNTPNVIVRQ